jgi:hypothetical protein
MLLDLRNSLSAKSRCSLEADDTQGGPRHIHENNLPEANVSETVQSPHREYTSQHLIAEPCSMILSVIMCFYCLFDVLCP